LPLRTRLFLSARLRLTPYEQIASRLPARGRILDLGCGHGLLALTIAQERPDCSVLGIDHDAARIAIAAEAGRSVANARFAAGTLTAPPPGPFSGIALVDVLHYFAPAVQESIVREAQRRLEPGGTLLVREVDPEGGVAARWNRWYERLATGIGFTRTERGAHHFRSRAGWIELITAGGLAVTAERCSSALFADVLYVGRRDRN
jgi:2-polyprenyl-3-methyl-5-hydroxy-6-metoxy-1,4-benzoquinol methylase